MNTAITAINTAQLEARIQQLDDEHAGTLADVFAIVCGEFGLDADALAEHFGCRCPWGLLGYVEGAQEEDDEFDALMAETERLLAL
jgi:hypothetical protein